MTAPTYNGALAGGVPARNYKIKVDVTTAGGDVLEYYVGLLIDPSVATVLPAPDPAPAPANQGIPQ